MIIAAGLSRRYGTPKVLVPVGPGGELLIDYGIHDAAKSGFRRVLVVTRPELREKLETHLRTTWGDKLAFQFVYQELTDVPPGSTVDPQRVKPWGTGHAVLAVRHLVHESFVVINCDDFYGRDAFTGAALHLKSDSPSHALVGYRLDETLSPSGGVSRGECKVDSEGNLERLTEVVRIRREDGFIVGETDPGELCFFSGLETVSMNFWAFRPSIFPILERLFVEFLRANGGDASAEFFLSNTINDAIAAKLASVSVLRSSDTWFGMTYQADLPAVLSALESLAEDGVYPSDIATLAEST